MAEYIGQTAPKTAKRIEDAKDGVLFIDEAYRLTPTSPKDFGQEAINTIMSFMDDVKKEKPVFIFAGYKQEMEEFIAVNDGFRRRVGHTIHMSNYTDDDLATMTRRQLFQQRFKFPIDADFTQLYSGISDDIKNYTNAGLVSRFIREMKNSMNTRLPDDADGQSLLAVEIEDLTYAIGRINNTMKPNEMVRVRKKVASTQTDSGTDFFMNILK